MNNTSRHYNDIKLINEACQANRITLDQYHQFIHTVSGQSVNQTNYSYDQYDNGAGSRSSGCVYSSSLFQLNKYI